MKKVYITHSDIYSRCLKLADKIMEHWRGSKVQGVDIYLYPVPRGGVPCAYVLSECLQVSHGKTSKIITDPTEADFIVDDIIDSGKTRKEYKKQFPGIPFFAVIEKKGDNDWVVFPWEVGKEDTDESAEDICTRLLQRIGEDPDRDGLKDTPKRFIKAWDELTVGYKQHPKDILGVTFDNEGNYDEMIICRDIEFHSTCEHHLIPIVGKAHIAYIPNGTKEKPGKVVGLSKLARLVDIYARRLQIQERLTQQIAGALEKYLDPLGVAVYIEAKHFCMVSRGVMKQNSVMVTSALKGKLKDQIPRLESLFLVKRG